MQRSVGGKEFDTDCKTMSWLCDSGASSSSDCVTNSEAQQTENPDTSEIFSMNDWDNWLT